MGPVRRGGAGLGNGGFRSSAGGAGQGGGRGGLADRGPAGGGDRPSIQPVPGPGKPGAGNPGGGRPGAGKRRQILLDPESRDRIGPVSANRVIDRVIDQATAIGLVTDQGTVPETATGRATGRVMVIDPATSRAVMIGPATSRAMVTGPATSRAMATALGIDPATDRAFTRRLTATDRVTGRAIVRLRIPTGPRQARLSQQSGRASAVLARTLAVGPSRLVSRHLAWALASRRPIVLESVRWGVTAGAVALTAWMTGSLFYNTGYYAYVNPFT